MSTLEPLTLTTFVVLGLVVGSFINVVILRLPAQLQSQWRQQARDWLNLPGSDAAVDSVVRPASHCPVCKQRLSWWHNIPLLSFIVLRARCAHCHAPIAWQYPVVELGNALWWLLSWLQSGGDWPTALWWSAWGSALLCLAWIDALSYLLPDALTLPLLWAALLWASLGRGSVDLHSALWGAVVGYGLLALPAYLYQRVTGRQGMAGGDFKLLAAIGAALGPWPLPAILLIACLTGLSWAVIRAWRGHSKGRTHDAEVPAQAIPFGPALAIAAALVHVGALPALGLQWLA